MPRDEDYLADILEAADLIESYADGLTRASLSQDTKTRDALMRQLQVIGEARGQAFG